jgi:EmrB/QacA subfamily drug resistance transporter
VIKDSGDAAPAKRWWILATVAIAQLMVVLDATIVNIALPAAQSDLGFDNAGRQWVVTAYSLAFGGLLLLCGRINDLFGQKRSFVVGLVGFALASALGGWAPDFTVLIVARAVQGAFGALLAPAALSIMTVTFAGSKDRGRAFGVYGAVAGGGGAIGLLLGGVLTDVLSWRWCLYVNVVFAAVAVAGALLLLPRQAPRKPAGRTDWAGTVLVVSGLFALVFGFGRSETTGWTDSVTLIALVAGVVLLAAFVRTELRVENPLLPMAVVLDRVRGTSCLVMLLAAVGMFSIYLFLTYYLQKTLGYSPILAGLAFLPMALSTAISSTVSSSVVVGKIGLKAQVPFGALLATAGLLYLTTIDAGSAYATGVLPGLVLAGTGLGAIFSSAMGSATLGVRAQQAGIASAMVNTTQQIGGSIGVALLSSISVSASTRYLAAHTGDSPAVRIDSTIAGYHAAFWCAAASLALAGVVALWLYPSRVVSREGAVPEPALV